MIRVIVTGEGIGFVAQAVRAGADGNLISGPDFAETIITSREKQED